MQKKFRLKDLEIYFHEAADILRGNMNASEFKSYVLGVLFLKRLSDTFDEEQEKVVKHYLDNGKTLKQAENLAKDEDEYDNAFFIPEAARWSFLKDMKHNIGLALNTAMESIEEYNSILKGVLVSTDFSSKQRISDNNLQRLLCHFSTYRLRNEDFEEHDILGTATEYFIKMFADSAGKKGGEFYTPIEVSRLLVSLLKPTEGMQIYDPTAGSGGMLIQARNYLKHQGENEAKLSLFGQEMNLNIWAICKMNLLLHNAVNIDIRRGDTLRNPQHIIDSSLMQFDRVIANPPYSLKSWGEDELNKDIYNRFCFGMPPKHSGDFAFVQHMLASTKSDGMAGVILPHGVLFRSSSEKDIRHEFLKNDLIEIIISLPSGLFYGTGIPVCIIIFNKNKQLDRKGKLLFIDASSGFKTEKYMKALREQDIAKIIDSARNFESSGTYSKVIDINEILNKNDANLNVRKYVDDSEIAKQIKNLLSHHVEFKKYKLSNKSLVKSLTVAKKGDGDTNVIYIHRIATAQKIKLILNEKEKDSKDFYKIEFNTDLLINRYAQLYFESKLGRLVLSYLPSGTSLPSLSSIDIKSLEIPVPPPRMQQEVIRVANKLSITKKQIDELTAELTTKPTQFKNIESETDAMIHKLSELSDSQYLAHLMETGETRYIEFKQTFFINVDRLHNDEHPKKKCKDVQTEVIKDIVSFINHEGGTLLLGVNDNGKEVGVDKEMALLKYKKMDNFFQDIGAQIQSRIGDDYQMYCQLSSTKLNGKTIVRIDCKPAPYPFFLDKKGFHVRNDTASPALHGHELLKYINNHF
jgi:type I restriction system adenine methylase HsdM